MGPVGAGALYLPCSTELLDRSGNVPGSAILFQEPIVVLRGLYEPTATVLENVPETDAV